MKWIDKMPVPNMEKDREKGMRQKKTGVQKQMRTAAL